MSITIGPSNTFTGTVTSSGAVNITNATVSTSRTTGCLVTTGGIGCQGNIYTGSLNAAGTLTVAGVATLTGGSLIINNQAGEAGSVRLNGFSGSYYNFLVSAGHIANDVYEVIPSTAVGGSTFSTPILKANAASGVITLQQASTSAKLAINGSTVAAGAATATMTNAPAGASGNPDLWAQITYNGVDYVLPLWTP